LQRLRTVFSDTELEDSLLGRGYWITIRFIPYPEQLYLEVLGLIFKDPETDEY
jgi:hypothetical protein